MKRQLSELVALRNPIVLGSGPLGYDANFLIKFSAHAGAVISKGITKQFSPGNPKPRIVHLGDLGLINFEGGPNLGIERFVLELRRAKAECACPVIGALLPGDVGELVEVAQALEEAGADAMEMDFKWGSGTGGKEHGPGFETKQLYEISRSLKNALKVPVIAKISPRFPAYLDDARAAVDGGADAISAINTVYPAMKIDLRKGRPKLAKQLGGLSGRAVLPVAVGMTFELYRHIDVPIFGVGGVTSGEDALELIYAGASAVQICTVAMKEGPKAFKRIDEELRDALERLGHHSVEECRGLAHQL